MINKDKKSDKLIERLYAVMDFESQKPYNEVDTDLIEACTELILELQGKNFTMSKEEIQEKVNKIPFVDIDDFNKAKRKKVNKRKLLLLAAVISILCILLSTTSISQNFDSHRMYQFVKDKFGSVFNVPVGVPQIDGNQEFIHNGKPHIYHSAKDFWEREKLDILLPAKELPNDIEIVTIDYAKEFNSVCVLFTKDIVSYEVALNSELPQWVKDYPDTTFEINGILCYADEMPDVGRTQIYFEHKGNAYTIGTTNIQILPDFIKSLEDAQ